VLAICCDVADAAGVAKAFAAVAQTFGRLDVLVNNAGSAIFKPILNITYEEWSRVLAVNLTGPFLCTQAARPTICSRRACPCERRRTGRHRPCGKGRSSVARTAKRFCDIAQFWTLPRDADATRVLVAYWQAS